MIDLPVEEYKKCAHFDKPCFVSKPTLYCIRLLFFMFHMGMFSASIGTNEFLWFWYYLTFQSFCVTMFSALASFKASSVPAWQTAAMFSAEIAFGLNWVATILFWVVLAPSIFPTLKWHGMDLFLRVHLTTLHSVPFAFSVTNIALTDMVILKKDTKWVFCAGIQYLFANLIGTIAAGHPLYPIVDWKNPT